jgi:hypothetical protein
VLDLAAVLGPAPDVRRPLPARLVGRAPDRHPAELHELEDAVLERPDLVGLLEAADLQLVHRRGG